MVYPRLIQLYWDREVKEMEGHQRVPKVTSSRGHFCGPKEYYDHGYMFQATLYDIDFCKVKVFDNKFNQS